MTSQEPRVARRSSTPRDQRRDSPVGPSREAILEAARRLYASSDYAGVTMRAVAKEVGCRSPSLYHYFESKDEIFRALVDSGVRLYEQFLPDGPSPDPLAQLWWRFWRYYEFSKAHPEYFRLLFVERSSPVGDPALRARVLGGGATRASIESCIEAGLLPVTTDVVATSVVLWTTIHGAAVMGMRSTVLALARDELAETTLRLAFEGVRLGLLPKRKEPTTPVVGTLLREAAAESGTVPNEDSLRGAWNADPELVLASENT